MNAQAQTAAKTETKPDLVLATFIRCTRDALWDALTDPELMGKYNFVSGDIRKEGDTFLWRAGDQTLLKCRTIETDPKSRIVSTFEPQSDDDGKPSRTVMLIDEEGDYCRLTLEHYDLTFPVTPGQGVHDGWSRWSSALKTWLETGETVRFNSRAAS